MTTYTVERATEYTEELRNFVNLESKYLADLFDNKLDPSGAAIEGMIKHAIFLVGKRDGEIRGVHISWLTKCPLDMNTKILQQQLFYVKPDSGRLSYHLFNKFIDIGRSEANHIITMLTRQTNIKSHTLENLGFKELEVLYRMEV